MRNIKQKYIQTQIVRIYMKGTYIFIVALEIGHESVRSEESHTTGELKTCVM